MPKTQERAVERQPDGCPFDANRAKNALFGDRISETAFAVFASRFHMCPQAYMKRKELSMTPKSYPSSDDRMKEITDALEDGIRHLFSSSK